MTDNLKESQQGKRLSQDFLLSQIKKVTGQDVDLCSLGVIEGPESPVKVINSKELFGIYPFTIPKGEASFLEFLLKCGEHVRDCR